MKDRIKHLRKDILKLTMEEFGERVGLSKAAISQIESGKSGLSDVAIKAICNEYNINESWLRTGEGPMRQPDPENEIDAVVKKYDLTPEAKVLIEKFVKLNSDHRQAILDYFDSVSEGLDKAQAERQLDEDYAREKANRKAAATSSGSVSTTA